VTRRLPVGLGPGTGFLVSASLLLTAVLTVLALPGYQARPTLVAPAVLVDLALGLPLLGYPFLVRTGRRHPSILLPLGLLGLFLARWWIPAEHLGVSIGLDVLAAGLEGALLVLLVLRIRGIRSAFTAMKGRVPYPADALRHALREGLGPRLGAMVFSEASVLWYSVAGWRPRAAAEDPGRLFPGHRRNAYPAVLGALLMAIVVETGAVHLLVALWWEPVAWVLTILGVYSVFWLLGDFNAARSMPSLLTDRDLHLRAGLRWSADVPLSEIRSVHEDAPDGETVDLALWGRPDLWLETRGPVRVQGPFGLVRQVRYLGVGVDDPRAVRRAIDEGRGAVGHSARS
jgi:hypothetical protein